MKRRDFLKYSSLSTLLLSQYLYGATKDKETLFDLLKSLFENEKKDEDIEIIEPRDSIDLIKELQRDERIVREDVKENTNLNDDNEVFIEETDVKEEITSIKKKDTSNIFIEEKDFKNVTSITNKLRDIQRYVGYGNFNLISFDEMLKIPEYSGINLFTKEEIAFLEYIFYYSPDFHGFYGERVSHKITDSINKNDVIKIPNTGHYLFKGEPYKTYLRMCDDIGETLILTSGIRSIVKQSKLFLDKLKKEEGNLSQTSKSLAPPAYTYHTISDFDVGKKGFGYANFTSRFALTEEFFKMRKLEYIDIRYTIKNLDGVRYEPWHVKIV